MSKIDELIQELCPDGVEYRNLGDVVQFRRGTTITKQETIPGNIPVIAGGQKPSYFHSVANRDGETITVAGSGAYAGFISFWRQPIFVSDAFTVEPDLRILTPRFLYHLLKNLQEDIHQKKTGGGIPHVYGKDLANFRIPVPPISIQRTVNEMLDAFTELETVLEAELEERRKQYHFYRDSLFNPLVHNEVSIVSLSELTTKITDGSHNPPKHSFVGTFPMLSAKNIQNGKINFDEARMLTEADFTIENKRTAVNQGDVLLTIVGAIGRVAVVDTFAPMSFQRSVCVIKPRRDLINPRYLFHFFQTSLMQNKFEISANGAAQKGIYLNQIQNLPIPLPSLPAQLEIVETLDSFEYITQDLQNGLPAELAARRKQYEYYRDKLLTFKELAA